MGIMRLSLALDLIRAELSNKGLLDDIIMLHHAQLISYNFRLIMKNNWLILCNIKPKNHEFISM